MRLLDSRRLMGPNLYDRAALAIAEVGFDDGEDSDRAIAAWRVELARIIPTPTTIVRRFRGGAALCVQTPIDRLLVATDVNEWAIERATSIAAGSDPGPGEPRRQELAAALEAARDDTLLSLQHQAAERGLTFLWDDECVSIGAGRGCRLYLRAALPTVAEVPWSELGRVPIALITGTNGKTTSARLVARIARTAGLAAGLSSTDGVQVDEAIIERGDWTGPNAARAVLRRPEVQVAVLETARGGILRRGLAIATCDASLITNVSADHLGDYGVDDVATMARAKAVVAHAVRSGGRVVLNAGDSALAALAPTLAAEVIWFALDPKNALVAGARARGGEVWFVAGGSIVRARGESETALVSVAEIPITFGGAAHYNIENALGAAALAGALGIDDAAIALGLRSFEPTVADSPGRGNFIDHRGVKILLDFGHNPEGIRAVLSLVERLRGSGSRLFVILAQPGDRDADALAAVAAAVAEGHPLRLFIYDMIAHLRGRSPGETPALLGSALLALGVSPDAIALHDDEPHALAAALDGAHPGDFIVILPHLDRAGVDAVLRGDAREAQTHH